MPAAPHASITLHDGRTLSYAEYGAPDGEPVFYFHGSPGSRLEALLAHDAARRLGVRIVAPERPGYGDSTFQPNRRFDLWPRDIAALADALGLGCFSLIGLSGGGPHVVACAVAMPGRVKAAAIVSGAGPVDAYIARSTSRIGRIFRRAAMPFARFGIKLGVRMLPWALRRTSAKRMSTWADKRVLASLEHREAFRDELLEGLRPGARGAVHEFDLHTRPWPMDPGRVDVPVHLWHGDGDVVVGVDIGRYLAARIPGCRSTIIPNEGHLLIVERIEEILRALVVSR